MVMPGRKYSAGTGYRYGFNGKEKSDEVYGEGNVYDYGFRIYNPRLGRFLSVDPLTKSYPWYTPYQFAGNKPIIAVDLDGLEEKYVTTDINFGRNMTVENASSKTIETGFKFGVIPSAMGTGMLKVGYVPDGPLGSGTLFTLNYSYHTTPDDPNGDKIVSGQIQFYIPSKADMKEGMGGLYMVSANGRSGGNDSKRSISGDELIPINVDLLIGAAGFPGNSSIDDIFRVFTTTSNVKKNIANAEKIIAVLEGIKTVVEHDKLTEAEFAFFDEIQKMADKERSKTNSSKNKSQEQKNEKPPAENFYYLEPGEKKRQRAPKAGPGLRTSGNSATPDTNLIDKPQKKKNG
jgi:RHS repeat-associated protein